MICNKCGEMLKENDKFCEKCGFEVDIIQKNDTPIQKIEAKNENIVLGILGALLGSFAGVVAIIGFDYIGFVAALSGLIMGLCTFGLYKKFAGSISVKGIIISVLIMIIMTYLAVHLSYTIQILKLAKEEGVDTTFGYVFQNLKYILQNLDAMGDFYASLAMVYLFTILGSVGTIVAEFKQIKGNK